MLRLADHWVWDSWYVRDGGQVHMFFLRASRALIDPNRRHLHAAVGHAVSTDLRTWTLLPDALTPADVPAWDDYATWTGSTVRGHDGRWHMFYTGVARVEGGSIQRIGHAVSDDLVTWERVGDGLVCGADHQWYEDFTPGFWHDEAWRDPWVFFNETSALWHMIVTARGRIGQSLHRATVGHATSPDLMTWTVRPPLTGETPFGQMEVTQVARIGEQWVLVFCVAAEHVSTDRGLTPQTGTWSAPADSPTGPYHVERAELIGDGALYAGRIVQDSSGVWNLLGFVHDEDGAFGGYIPDPIPLELTARGTLQPRL